MKYYTKVEAVNIYNHIADTNQLSIIRGGGLLLKAAIDEISSKTQSHAIETLSSGASQGIFSCDSKESSKTLIEIIKSVLNKEDYIGFTFLYDTVSSDCYDDAREKLIALTRFRQLQNVSESSDSKKSSKNDVSSYSGLRKAQITWSDGKSLSAFDLVRFRYGTENRQSLFKQERCDSSPCFSLDFKATNDLKSLSYNPGMGNLNNKIAVFYCDGNSFSSIQSDYIASSPDKDKAQKEFDNNIKSKRRHFLSTLTDLFNSNKNPAFQTSDGESRLEVLLWGGDEMIIVVPAWIGMLTLSLFYKQSSEWKIETPEKADGKFLKHSAGLVFANAKTPIMKLTQLARDLADGVKERTFNGQSGRSDNFFDFITLESVDYPTESLDKHLETTYPLLEPLHRPFLKPCLSPSIITEARTILNQLPRSQFYRHVRVLTSTNDGEEKSKSYTRLENSIRAVDKTLLEKVNNLSVSIFGECCKLEEKNIWGFIYLLQLWDYLEAPVEVAGIRGL